MYPIPFQEELDRGVNYGKTYANLFSKCRPFARELTVQRAKGR